MTAPTDQFAEIASRGQEAVTTAVRTWADTVQSFASKATAGPGQLPDLPSVVDTYFDFAEKVLANQREFVSQWASAAAKASEAVTEQAHRATQSVTAHTVNGTEAAVDNATETVKVAGEKAVSTARAARNATKA